MANYVSPTGTAHTAYGGEAALAELRKFADLKLNEAFKLQDTHNEDYTNVSKFTMPIDPGKRTEGHFPVFGTTAPAKEWMGEMTYQKFRVAEKIAKIQKWYIGQGFDRDDLEDEYGGLLKDKIPEMSVRAKQWEISEWTKYICAGDGTHFGHTALGHALFANDHTWGDSGDNDNLIGAVANTLSGIQTGFQSAMRMLLIMTDDHGQPLPPPSGGYTIMCHPIRQELMRQFLNANYFPVPDAAGGATDNIYRGAADLWVNPWLATEIATRSTKHLTTSLTWWVFRNDTVVKPICMLDREAPWTEVDYHQNQETYEYKLCFRRKMDYWNWLGAIQIGG